MCPYYQRQGAASIDVPPELHLLLLFCAVLCLVLCCAVSQVFMLPSDRRLDESTLQDVLVSGHSRVPVHEPGNR
jgi:hypothetical protein